MFRILSQRILTHGDGNDTRARADIQQRDAARRLLIVLHPWSGLSQADTILGTWEEDMRPGWNRTVRDPLAQHPEVFVFIGGETAKQPQLGRMSLRGYSRHSCETT
jgi:hypothetical protein